MVHALIIMLTQQLTLLTGAWSFMLTEIVSRLSREKENVIIVLLVGTTDEGRTLPTNCLKRLNLPLYSGAKEANVINNTAIADISFEDSVRAFSCRVSCST